MSIVYGMWYGIWPASLSLWQLLMLPASRYSLLGHMEWISINLQCLFAWWCCLSLTHSLTAALDQLRVVAISTTSGPGLWIDRHWWVRDPYLLPPVEAKFSVDGPAGASSQWQEVCRWRHQWIDVLLVKQVYPWIIGQCGQKVSGIDQRWSLIYDIASLLHYSVWSL